MKKTAIIITVSTGIILIAAGATTAALYIANPQQQSSTFGANTQTEMKSEEKKEATPVMSTQEPEVSAPVEQQPQQAPVFDYDEFIRQSAAQNNASASYEDLKSVFILAFGQNWADSNAQEKTMVVMDVLTNPSDGGRIKAGVRNAQANDLLYKMRNYLIITSEFHNIDISGFDSLRK